MENCKVLVHGGKKKRSLIGINDTSEKELCSICYKKKQSTRNKQYIFVPWKKGFVKIPDL